MDGVCREMVAARGWQETQVYSALASSGSNRFRPAYQEMIADARRGAFDVVVAEALDRLAASSGTAGTSCATRKTGKRIARLNPPEEWVVEERLPSWASLMERSGTRRGRGSTRSQSPMADLCRKAPFGPGVAPSTEVGCKSWSPTVQAAIFIA